MFCESVLWDREYTWNTTDPDFTPCFQKTVLLWTPCFYLLILSAARILALDTKHISIIPWSWKSRTKLALAGLIMLLLAMDIVKSLQEHFSGQQVPVVDFISPLLVILTMVVYCIVVHYERKSSVRSSGFLIIFLFLFVIAGIVMLRSKIRVAVKESGAEDTFRFVTFCLLFVVLLALLVISCMVDNMPVGDVPTEKNPCPEYHVSFLSRLTFWWFTGLVVKGYKKALEVKDLWSLNLADKCANVFPLFNKFWQKELQKCKRKQEHADATAGNDIEMKVTKSEDLDVKVTPCEKKKIAPRLFLCMVKAFGLQALMAVAFKFVFDVLQFVNPLLLKALIAFTSDKSEYVWRGYMYAVLIFLVVQFQSLLLHQYFHLCTVLGMRLRTAVIALVYRKTLRLSSAARKTSTVGEIVNLMSVDAQRFMDMMTFMHMIWSGPVQITLSIVMLWLTLGPSILAGVAIMIIAIPANAFIAGKTKKLQVQQMRLKDTRIKMMNEILNGIKVLKLYAWEGSFEKKVLDVRNKELSVLKKMSYLTAGSTFMWNTVPIAVCLVTFAVYVLIDSNNVLDAEKAFVSLSLFNILRFPLSMVPQTVTNMIQANVSLKRVGHFLANEELDEEAILRDTEAKASLHVQDGKFTWDDDGNPTLRNINLRIPEGSLVAVVGTVGSGKSSLLQSILGEMNKVSGQVTVKGSVAYVAQQAWIQNATVQDNILFGRSMDLRNYLQVIEACALQPDLEIMEAGDKTEIGEKGINLSGGQKQRVSLARAVYQDRDLYLLDDPLSAVDSHVGKHIFDHVIGPDGVLKNKTRLLVTHGIGFLPQVDMIVVLVDGQISELGTYQELLSHNGPFAQFLKNYLTEELEAEELDAIAEDMVSQLGSVVSEDDRKALVRQVSVLSDKLKMMSEKETSPPRSPDLCSSGSASPSPDRLSGSKTKLAEEEKAPADEATVDKTEEKKKLIAAESVQTGQVKLSVFGTYLKAVGAAMGILTVVFFILYNAGGVYSNIWLSEWSDDSTKNNGTIDPAKQDMRLGVYGALGILQGLFVLLATLCLWVGNVRAGRLLHAKVLKNIVASPMSFFDTTPVGRILNRFSKDIDALDTRIPSNFSQVIQTFLRVINVPIVVGYSTPIFLVVVLPLTIIYIVIQRFYVATSRQLKRLESVSRSPIYSHFGETVTGASTVRAYQQQERFIAESENKVDENIICHYPSVVSNRWLAICLDCMGNLILLFAALFAVINRDHLSPGIVGLSVMYALNVTQTLNWMVRMVTELETNIVAVERLKEYTKTPTEAAWIVEDQRPDKSWPKEGKVVFDNYGMRYREGLDLVIKEISCTITPGEKIGIVGRTGAGKSSLTLALFRILEAAMGRIKIDDLDVGVLGLHDLRSKLTVIPQEPVLFSGTLRMNLDPFDQYSDETIWTALEHAHLKSFVSGLEAGLEHECSEGGENLSVGQRQLVCLARALLRKTKILILDEATAAVDLETDDLIQHTIRVEFESATVLTIAHRLNTILDYTRVMVLDAGTIKEFESPQTLLQDSNSIFYSMAKDAGLVA